jgi:glycosyltransferase involved in cell wall biosynthesis
MITYNHEPYIAEAIESVLSQQFAPPYELVIGEDCSTDRTGEIVRSYGRAHPDRIRVLPSERNLGVMPNWVRTLNACRGEYIALLDGDDAWTSPGKLEKQIALLDRSPDLAQSCHVCLEVYEDGRRPAHEWPARNKRPRYGLADLVRGPICNSSSLVLRRQVVDALPDWFVDAPVGDWTIQVLSALHGDVGFIDEVMSKHRNHAGGVYAGEESPRQFEKLLKTRRMFAPLLPTGFEAALREGDFHTHYRKSRAHERLGELAEAARCLAYCRENLMDRGRHSVWKIRKRALRLRFRRLLGAGSA